MGLFGKNITMTYDEALEILLDGTVDKKIMKAAGKNLIKNPPTWCCSFIGGSVACLRELYKQPPYPDAAKQLLCGIMLGLSESDELVFEYAGKIIKRFPELCEKVPDYCYGKMTENKEDEFGGEVFCALCNLYGWGCEPDVQKAEFYADRAENLKKDNYTENLRTRIEIVKNKE